MGAPGPTNGNWVSTTDSSQSNQTQPSRTPKIRNQKFPSTQLPIIIYQTRTIEKSGHSQQQKEATSMSVSNQALPGGYPVINKKTTLDQLLLMSRVANQAPLRRPGCLHHQSALVSFHQEIKHKSGAKWHSRGHIGAYESAYNYSIMNEIRAKNKMTTP